MSITSKVYKFQSGAWVHIGDTSGTSMSTGLTSADRGKIFFWRVDTYDTDTELTTTGDVWVFWLTPSPSFTTFTLNDYDITVACTVMDYSASSPWIPSNYTVVLPGVSGYYPDLDPSDYIEFDPLIEEPYFYINPGFEWQFIDGEWQWASNINVVGGGRYQNKMVMFSHNCIYYEG
jgi:hypothetical protein